MKRLTALAWKEWHEARIFLWIGLGIFAGLPLIAGVEELFRNSFSRPYQVSVSPWVALFGGVLAIFVAVGATCRDFRARLRDFWRSQPVGLISWLLLKYFIGLLVVLLACLLPLGLELALNRDKSAIALVVWFPFLWAAIYSLGFLAGCLLRRTAQAVMVALAAMLVVYLMPVVLPPLQWLSVEVINDQWWQPLWNTPSAKFAAGMLGIAVVVLILSLLAVRRNWRVEAGRKMLYAAIAAVLFLLFGSAAFQLGTNLPVLQQIPLPADENLRVIRSVDQGGFLLGERIKVSPTGQETWEWYVRELHMTSEGIKLGNATEVDQSNVIWFYSIETVVCPDHPEIRYSITTTNKDVRTGPSPLELSVYQPGVGVPVPVQRLWDNPSDERWPCLYAWRNRLYIFGKRLVILDITQPLAPRMISDEPFSYSLRWTLRFPDAAASFSINLPPVLQLPPRQRLAAVVPYCWLRIEGDTVCTTDDQGRLFSYRLSKLTDDRAVFQQTGSYHWSMLERMFNRHSDRGMELQNGLLYLDATRGFGHFNPCISIFDTRGRQPLRLIGHFAAQGVEVVCPLPDGRAIVGGSQLWLVGPPPHRDGG